ncbi:MAG: TrkH family potassium uptake protein [Actinophytocola sp.]|nr:TrkH family potassium uptake protein [Actinophytocola sp.]
MLTGFAGAILLGTVLLSLPFATETGQSAGFVTALFTSTSAVCVTGLIVESTPDYFSTFGEVVILGLIQVGGLGIMTMASLLGLLVARRFGLRMQLTAQAETKSLGLGEVRQVVAGVLKISVAFEIVVAIIFTVRLITGDGESFGKAAYFGVFHAISAFNNAGFSLYANSLEDFVSDPWISITVAIAVICGGIGFPVLFELARRARKPRAWTLHTKITLLTTGALLVVGFVFITAAEWSNPDTMGPLGVGDKLLSGFFMAVMPRTAGFNSLVVGDMNPATLLLTDVLMFIGGGSAGTAGGIKVTTFALLAFVIAAEVRGEPSVHVMGRKLSASVQRQALTIALIGVGVVMTATIALLAITDHTMDRVLFEVVSAFGTVGLSAGITGELGSAGEVIITLLMFIGRLGPITAATALALRDRPRRYELPESRPIVG